VEVKVKVKVKVKVRLRLRLRLAPSEVEGLRFIGCRDAPYWS
jgi:hypothetical protein